MGKEEWEHIEKRERKSLDILWFEEWTSDHTYSRPPPKNLFGT
jgi:hypothetical protein